MTEIIPPKDGISFAKEARDLLIECCVEFITLISSEANEISEKEAKKTIACDHITKALEQLGFSDYVPAVLEAAAEHKEVQKVSYGSHSLCPITSLYPLTQPSEPSSVKVSRTNICHRRDGKRSRINSPTVV